MADLPVILIGGQLLNSELWTHQVAALRAAGHAVMIADHQQDDTIAQMARRLLDAAPERFALVGFAMGGFVAFEVMRTARERVARMALIGTLARNDGPEQTARRQGYIDLVEGGNFAEVIEERIPMLFSPAMRDNHTLLSIARRMAADTGPATFLRQQHAIMNRVDSRPDLKDMTVPTLLLWGHADGITTRAYQDEMLDRLPNARLEVLPHAGHLSTLEQPDAVNRSLLRWLAGGG